MRRKSIVTELGRYYEENRLPLRLNYSGGSFPSSFPSSFSSSSSFCGKRRIAWTQEVSTLDYHIYLPLLFEGLRETEDPVRFIAIEGSKELLQEGNSKILPVIPQLIVPIKKALNTCEPEVITNVIIVVQALVQSSPLIGPALVPYYRQILPVFNKFISSNVKVTFFRRKSHAITLGDLVQETLQLLESKGGDDAFINIKYVIPTYQSIAIH